MVRRLTSFIENRKPSPSASSITSAIGIDREGQRLVEGSIRHVCVDAQGLGKVPAPPLLRDALTIGA